MQKVIVTAVGTQTDAYGEESRIELITPGTCHEKNGISYIQYRESEITGMEGTTTLLKIRDREIALIRMGVIEQKQEFRLEEQSDSTYVTSFGVMNMRVFTKRLKVAVDKGIGYFQVDYELEINGQWQSSNTLSVQIREEE